MKTSESSPILIRSLFFSLLCVLAAASSDAPSSIYDVLRSHGLPIGLLPKGIKQFEHDPSTGQFQVHLEKSCNAMLENLLHYDWNISGTLSYGLVRPLSGISAQELFLWFPVQGIRVDDPSSGLIHFDVGVVDKQFSLSLFETPPDCTAAASPPGIALQDGKIIPRTPYQSESEKLGVVAYGDEMRAAS